MNSTSRRAIAAIFAVLFTVTASPAAAADPTPSPALDSASPTPEPTSPMTIHAEMAAEHDGSQIRFEAGARPDGLARPDSEGGRIEAAGAIAGLPNGLQREVFGYLPSWALTTSLLSSLNYDLVSTIAYFGVPARGDGTLNKADPGWDGWNSTHMTNVINEAHAEGVKVVLTVTMMAWNRDYTAMSSLLNSATRRAKLAGEIAAALTSRNADGVNLDFEPMPNSLQSVYTAFVRQVKSAIGSRYLTVATTGGAASWDEGYDLAGLTASGAADALMVMGYDFNWSGSAYAGGVAPIDSSRVLDVRSAMDAYASRVAPSKLIWGVPYYGRAWTTTGASLNGRTCASAGTCDADSWAFRYVDALDAVAKYPRRWDATGQVPWYTYRSSTYQTDVQGYYDDAASLNAKYDLVNAKGLRGVGIWHLLMDAGRWELWNELTRNFSALPFSDIDDSPFWQEIVWLVEQEITFGCGSGRFCPGAAVTRGEMASFLVRALDLPSTTMDYFIDDDSSLHEGTINRLAAAGITFGCGTDRFCPGASVRRDEMASFLARALDLPAATEDHFVDDDTNLHEGTINRIAEAGIGGGCATDRYCPHGFVTRGQMAAFLYRAARS